RHPLQRLTPRVTFEWFTDLSAEEMVKRVAELPPRSAIYYPTVRVDARGVPQEGDALLFRFIDLGRAPVFTHVDSHLGKGVVGGASLVLGGDAVLTVNALEPLVGLRERQRHALGEALRRGAAILPAVQGNPG